MKTITLQESQSKFARTLLVANSERLDKFVTFQRHEFRDVGALTETRIMLQIAHELGLSIQEVDYSKYNQFLCDIWVAARAHKIVVQPDDTIDNSHDFSYPIIGAN